MTPHAAAAIIAQIERKSDVWAEYWNKATDQTFNVGFAVSREWERCLSPYASGYVCECTVIGAWLEGETGNATFAGNRAELVALIEEQAVAAWEDNESDNQTERAAA